MNILFLSQNFPGEFGPLAIILAKDKQNNIIFYPTKCNGDIPRVKKIIYDIYTQEYSQGFSKYDPIVKAVFKTWPNLVKQLKASRYLRNIKNLVK